LSNKTVHIKKNLISAMRNSLGVVTTACEEVGISRTTYYDYYRNDEEFKKEVDSLADEALDFVESKLFERINGYEHKEDKIFQYEGSPVIVPTKKHYPPDPTSIIFYLKTKGKERGYIEKSEIGLDTPVNELIIRRASEGDKDK